MKKIRYLAIIPALAGILFLFPAAKPADAGSSFGIGFSFSAPYYYDPYPTYYYPPSYGTWYGYWDDRPYWRGYRYPRHYYSYPRHYRHYGDRHRYYDRRYRGYYDRW